MGITQKHCDLFLVQGGVVLAIKLFTHLMDIRQGLLGLGEIEHLPLNIRKGSIFLVCLLGNLRDQEFLRLLRA
jgi:hypothetical protein